MNKSYYNFGIIFLGLVLAAGIFQSILYLRLDNQLFTQQSFANWLLVTNLLGFVGSLLLLRYYRFRNYDFTFKMGVIVTVSTLFQFIVLYLILVFAKLQELYLPVAYFVAIVSVVYAITLIFSVAGKRPWLKTAGIFILLMSSILLAAGTGIILLEDVSIKMTLQKILQWTSVGYTLIPVFFIMNFRGEMSVLKPTNESTKLPPTLENTLSLVALAGIVFMLLFGVMLLNQGNSFLSWQNQNRTFGKDVLARHYEARTFVKGAGDTLRYQFMKPLDYDPQKKYPLVLCLHHGGTHGTDNFSQLGADPAPFLSSNRDKYPAFYLMPQCPKGFGWQNIDASIYEIIKTLEDEFRIDEQRRYVMGISGGGYGSWYFITDRPEMFAAAIPICGGGNPGLASKIAAVPVWAFHGEDDNLVPVRFSREMIDGIKKAGGEPKYTEFPDSGHNIWDQVSATPGLMDWLFAQKRDSLP